MRNTLILVAGIPGTGKTRLAEYLSERLRVTLICKDRLKEILWERLHYDTAVRTESQKYGGLAYDLSFHFCEILMKSGQSIVFESNFSEPCPEVLKTMVQRYDYRVITVLLDGDIQVLHRRFLERDATAERHPGLVSHSYFSDFERFQTGTRPCRDFSFGDVKILVDTTDFSKVSYEDIVERILQYIQETHNL